MVMDDTLTEYAGCVADSPILDKKAMLLTLLMGPL